MKKTKKVYLSVLREAKGLSQKELANEINVHPSLIALYETGRRKPKLERAIEISHFFGVPVEQIKFDCNDWDKTNDVR